MDTRLMCIFRIETRNSYEENRKIYEDSLSKSLFFQIYCQDVFSHSVMFNSLRPNGP